MLSYQIKWSQIKQATRTSLYCTVLYCTVLYCTVLHCTVLYCTVLYCTVLYCTVLYCTVLYCTVLKCSVMWHGCMKADTITSLLSFKQPIYAIRRSHPLCNALTCLPFATHSVISLSHHKTNSQRLATNCTPPPPHSHLLRTELKSSSRTSPLSRTSGCSLRCAHWLSSPAYSLLREKLLIKRSQRNAKWKRKKVLLIRFFYRLYYPSLHPSILPSYSAVLPSFIALISASCKKLWMTAMKSVWLRPYYLMNTTKQLTWD